MRMMGMGAQLDDLELSMNRAAEQAALAAKQIFINAITKMTFEDARKILSGGNSAATDYFKKTSSTELTQAFTPIVHQSMENVGVIKQFNALAQNSMAARCWEARVSTWIAMWSAKPSTACSTNWGGRKSRFAPIPQRKLRPCSKRCLARNRRRSERMIQNTGAQPAIVGVGRTVSSIEQTGAVEKSLPGLPAN
jgi:hypothetical protein